MKCYIAGPMHGMEGFNFQEFHKCAEDLRNGGWTVVNPAEIDHGRENWPEDTETWIVEPEARAFYLRQDLKLLLDCDCIILLDGWFESKGANIELAAALVAGLDVYRWNSMDGLTHPSMVIPAWSLIQLHVRELRRSQLERGPVLAAVD